MRFLTPWSRNKPAAVPPQEDSNRNAPESLPLPQVQDHTHDDSKKEDDNVLPSEVPSPTRNAGQPASDLSTNELVHMEQQQSDTPPGEARSSQKSTQVVQLPPGSVVAVSNLVQAARSTSETRTSAPGDHPSSPDQPVNTHDRWNALRNRWSQLAHAADSLTGDLISASDRRRENIEKRNEVLRDIEERLKSAPDASLLTLRDLLTKLQSSENTLLEQDENLVSRGYEFVAQGSKIFGVAADTSLEILDAQGIVVPATETATDPSVLSADDIRLDQTSEARRYLSRKGDVDLLRESLMSLDGEEIIASTLPGEAMPVDQLESRRQTLIVELQRAEADLETLRNNLPDRKVEIPEDQLRSPATSIATNEDASGQPDLGAAISGQTPAQALEPGTGRQPDDQTESLSQILDRVTGNSHVSAATLVNAYLLYQLQRSPEERKAFLKTVEEELKTGNPAGRVDLINDIPLEYWFDDENRTKKPMLSQVSLTKYIFSQPRSNVTDVDTAELRQLVHGNSEPVERRESTQHNTREEVRQHRLLARQKAKDTSSLR
ncbi:hypothetical protein PV04_02168 [Phialophora macrospora]|uniref:Uncharacterized protein n=1 Tax=Phialophora macrospora TaxID=1851006 RepID=A0A0D2FTJ8_9EURO|nr:hypothetical protein PV04_02168 [Phialophora macrospora]